MKLAFSNFIGGSKAAFSLVEILCAILILSIGVVGLTQGLTTALGSSKEAAMQSAAVLLAAGQIETLRAEGYLLEGETEGEGEGNLAGYKWRQKISETRIEGLYEVTVTIQQAGSGQEIYELTTLLFDPPIIREPLPDPRDRNERTRRRT